MPILFSTSTGAYAPCCASAINDAVHTIRRSNVDALSLVVVATPFAREGIALRKNFKADAVAEDVSGTLASIFHADPIFPNMYVIDSVGKIVLFRYDLQHNPLDTLIIPERESAGNRNAGAVKAQSSAPLIEDDDDIITDAKSATLNQARGVLEILEKRQNMIYHFNSLTGKLLAAIPPDTTLSFHFRRPGDDPEFWSASAVPGPRGAGRKGSGDRRIDSIFVADVAADTSYMYVLAISRSKADTNTQLYLQTYDVAGHFLGERPIATGADRIVSVQIIRCEEGGLSILTKREVSRWRIENFSLADFIASNWK